jgi:hypothetical protein
MANVQIRLRVNEEADLEVAQSLANEQPGLQVEATTDAPTGGFDPQMEPITAVFIGAGVVAVAKCVMDWWEKRRGGLVVDMRTSAKDQIHRDQNLPYGYVLIYSVDGGQVKIETHDMPKDAMQQLLEKVISGAYTTFTDIAKVALEKLPNASIEERGGRDQSDA